MSDVIIKPSVKESYYRIDISQMPSLITTVYRFMNMHSEFFKTNISKKIISIKDNQIYNIYANPVIFKDTIHKIKGFIQTDYNKETTEFKMVINIKKNKNNTCYIKQIEQYINKQAKNGSTVELFYNKILSESIIKHCFYNQDTLQWKTDVCILQNEFFLEDKEYLMSIMNNKIDNRDIGSTSSSWNSLILHGKPGTGKCLMYNTPVLMFNGDRKFVQNIVVSDLVMGDDSTARVVLSLAQGTEEMFEISQASASYTVNQSHILSLIYIDRKRIIYNPITMQFAIIWVDEYMVINTHNIVDKVVASEFYNQISNTVQINISVSNYLKLPPHMKLKLFGYRSAVDFSEQLLEIDPYYFGFWLVNKEKKTDKEPQNQTQKEIIRFLANDDLYFYIDQIRYIPSIYKVNSFKNRLDILAGIIDNIGFVNHKTNTISIKHMNNILLNDIKFIFESLGLTVLHIKDKLFITGNGLWKIPTVKKKIMCDKSLLDKIILEPIRLTYKGIGSYYGFELSNNHKFILGNFIVTHNSSFVYRTSMTLKMNIVSVDLSLYLNKKKELYSLFHNQEYSLPNALAKEPKQPALNNCIIVLEEFDTSIEKLLDIESIFKYKDILKRNYLDLKNKEIKKKALSFSNADDSNIADDHVPAGGDDDYEAYMEKIMLKDGYDTRNNNVLESAKNSILEQRDQSNELNSINMELNNIIKSMDDDNRSNILRVSDLLELFQGPVPILGRLIIATTNNFYNIKEKIPALFRSGRMSAIEFKYLDWLTLNKLTEYYFKQKMTLEPFKISIPTSQIVEMSIKYALDENMFKNFQDELKILCTSVAEPILRKV